MRLKLVNGVALVVRLKFVVSIYSLSITLKFPRYHPVITYFT
jgi:hypothetical protein